MLGGQPLHTFGDYLKTATLKGVANVSNGKEGVEAVLRNNEFLLESFNEILKVASENGDEGTVGMMSGWIGETEKRIWMLKAYLA
jgi:starvation-inducible DNA-binding protein